jgi:antitoxin ParD1/3/4
MAMVKKSITVTDQQDEWIKSQIASGQYGNDSEVLRDLIRREQSRNSEIEAIRSALIKAEGQGFNDRTPDEIRAAVQKRLRENGQL